MTTTNNHQEVEEIRAENARLIALLEARGIEWRKSATNADRIPTSSLSPSPSPFSTAEKIALFRRLFRGRTDAYPIRWESKKGTSGYSPACANEWRPGVCEKPRIKCTDCGHRVLLPLDDQVIFNHLTGKHVIGVFPMLPDDTCHFLAVDFDGAEWRADAVAFAQSCRELDVPVALEISRSGNGAHAWIFFSESVPARDARRLGSALISFTCARTRQLALNSYDRLFPNQDTMPKGGFGNLIALPLQMKAREQSRSVFVDETLGPVPDQWAFLASMQPQAVDEIEAAIIRATGGVHPLDVTFVLEDENHEPWKRPVALPKRIPGPQPAALTVTLADMIYIQKEQLTGPLSNRLVRLAAFQNPEFYEAQAMRRSVWNTPRVIGCAENHSKHIALPRGCLDAVRTLLRDNDIACHTQDERFGGDPITAGFAGTLRADQHAAINAMLEHETGVLCAPTAFGKTVTAAAMIARRGVNTLVLVHRTELLKQWRERLQTFLLVDKTSIGTIGGKKAKPSGKIDIAVLQSLTHEKEVDPLVERYGFVILDECHHVAASSFEAVLKKVRSKYLLGLTATPIRRDGRQPIIFMQCGPIRHTAAKPREAPHILRVIPRSVEAAIEVQADAGIQEVFRTIAVSAHRTALIAQDVKDAYGEGRKVLILTERTEHLEALRRSLSEEIPDLFVLHGRMSGKQRDTLIKALTALSDDAPRVLLATGRLIGEGFDHAPLDTLVLAMPIAWKGTLQQYAGRLHREHANKSDIRIYDYIDTVHPALLRMWRKRERGYRAMGYALKDPRSTRLL